MSRKRRSAPAVLHFLGGLTLLLLCPPAVQGNCGIPPDIPNAQPSLEDSTSFPEKTTITYKCNKGFVKVPGKPDSVVCLHDKWSEVAEFCNRSCDVPTRLHFASLKKSYSKQNYFPEGSAVEYECRPGYQKDESLSEKLTCLQNFKWSEPAEFCKKKLCANPGYIKNGHISITSGTVFGSPIFFSCNTGYKLVGVTSTFCSLVGEGVGWSDPLPECKEIFCPEPPKIDNGKIQEEQHSYVYGQAVTYQCAEGFTLVGESSILCVVKDDQGTWSGLPPSCKENPPATEAPTAVQKPTTVNAPAAELQSPDQKLNSATVPGTEVPRVHLKPNSVNAPATEPLLTTQKPSSETLPAAEPLLTARKPTSANLPAAEPPLTAQKPTPANVPATEPPLRIQKPTSENLAIELPPTPQKPASAKVSATEVPAAAQKPTVSNALPAETSPAAQNPITANATQATPTTQRSSTEKASFTQSLSTTQRSTVVHAPAAKGLQTPQTSAHVTATRGLTASRTTTRFHATSKSKGRGTHPSSGAVILTSGDTCVTLIVLIMTLIAIG